MKLDQFLKWNSIVATGGEAKQIITAGHVKVNGSIERRRGRKLNSGDFISFGDQVLIFGNNTDEKP
tara:strand:- start:6887 stop:7084 length:198 start_codon:yes stop_codon:yes gene_type:complete